MSAPRVVMRAAIGGLVAPEPPCPRCEVRADVGCRHRPATGVPPLAIVSTEPVKDKRQGLTGQGLAFHRDTIARNMERASTLLGLDKRGD